MADEQDSFLRDLQDAGLEPADQPPSQPQSGTETAASPRLGGGWSTTVTPEPGYADDDVAIPADLDAAFREERETFAKRQKVDARDEEARSEASWLTKTLTSAAESAADGQWWLEFPKALPSGGADVAGLTLMAPAVAATGVQVGARNALRRQLDVYDAIDRGEPIQGNDDPTGYRWATPEEKAAERARIQRMVDEQAITPVQDRSLYQQGQRVIAWGETLFPAAPGYESAISRQLGRGTGTVLFALPIGFLGTLPAGVTFASMGVGEAAKRAIEYDAAEKKAGRAGLTQEQIITAGLLGVGPGSTDVLPLENLLGRLANPIPITLRRPLAKAIARIGGQMFIEGVQEGGQEFLQNLIKQQGYDPNQALGENVPGSAALGTGVGGIVGTGKELGSGALRLASRRGGRGAPQTDAQPTEQPPAVPESPEAVQQPDPGHGSPPGAADVQGAPTPGPRPEDPYNLDVMLDPPAAPPQVDPVAAENEGIEEAVGPDGETVLPDILPDAQPAEVPAGGELLAPVLGQDPQLDQPLTGESQPAEIAAEEPDTDPDFERFFADNQGILTAQVEDYLEQEGASAADFDTDEMTGVARIMARDDVAPDEAFTRYANEQLESQPLSVRLADRLAAVTPLAEDAAPAVDVATIVPQVQSEMWQLTQDRGAAWEFNDTDIQAVAAHVARGLSTEEALQRYGAESYEAQRVKRNQPETIGGQATTAGGAQAAGQAGRAADASGPGTTTGSLSGRIADALGVDTAIADGATGGATGPIISRGGTLDQSQGAPADGRGITGLGGSGTQPAGAPGIAADRGPQRNAGERPEPKSERRGRLSSEFSDLLNGTLPPSEWASELDATSDELEALIARAIALGQVRLDRYGNVVRTPDAKRRPPVGGAPLSRLMSPTEAAISDYESKMGRLVSEDVRTAANVIGAIRGTPEFTTFVDGPAISSLSREEMVDLANIAGLPPLKANASKATSLKSLKDRHEDLKAHLAANARLPLPHPSAPDEAKVDAFVNRVEDLKKRFGIKTVGRRDSDETLMSVIATTRQNLQQVMEQVRSMKEGSRLAIIGAFVDQFKADADAVLSAIDTQNEIDLTKVSIEQVERFMDGVSDLQQILSQKTQEGYDVADAVGQFRELLETDLQQIDDTLTAIVDEADTILADLSEVITDIDNRFEQAFPEQYAARSEQNDSLPLGGLSSKELAVPLSHGAMVPEHFTLIDFLRMDADERSRALVELRTAHENLAGTEPAAIDDLDFEALWAMYQRVGDLESRADSISRMASDWQDLTLSEANQKVQTGVDAIEEQQVQPLLDRMEEAQATLDERWEEASEIIDLADNSGEVLFAVQTGAMQRYDLDNLGYYSKALEEAKLLKQAKGTPEQLLAQLKKAGVKEAEIRATGLDQFLTEKKQVSRDEIIQHLEANRVEVREAIYSGEARQQFRVLNDDTGEYHTFDSQREAQRFAVAHSNFQEVETVEATGQPAKWVSYSLDPSNPSYRETVIHLPATPDPRKARYEELGGRYSSDRERRRMTPEERAEYERLEEALETQEVVGDTSFRSGHWSEPNIIAHARTSLQKDADGKVVFLIDELQSDWGQKLREGGVRDEAKIAELEKRLKEAEDVLDSAVSEAQHWLQGIDPGVLYGSHETYSGLVRAHNDFPVGTKDFRGNSVIEEAFIRMNAYNKAVNDRNLLTAELRTAKASTPGHPLVNTTDQWVTTALRRLVAQAVAAGADKIAFTPGKVQAERFNQTQRVTGLRYDPETQRLQFMHDSETLRRQTITRPEWYSIDSNAPDGRIAPDALSSHVGPELAAQLLAQPRAYAGAQYSVAGPHTLSGLADVDIGGQGMRATYDGIYPRALAKILQKMDKSIKQGSESLRSSADGRAFARLDGAESMTTTQAMEARARNSGSPILFTTFPLTEAVKDSVGLGQALFSVAAQGSRDGTNPEGLSNASPEQQNTRRTLRARIAGVFRSLTGGSRRAATGGSQGSGVSVSGAASAQSRAEFAAKAFLAEAGLTGSLEKQAEVIQGALTQLAADRGLTLVNQNLAWEALLRHIELERRSGGILASPALTTALSAFPVAGSALSTVAMHQGDPLGAVTLGLNAAIGALLIKNHAVDTYRIYKRLLAPRGREQEMFRETLSEFLTPDTGQTLFALAEGSPEVKARIAAAEAIMASPEYLAAAEKPKSARAVKGIPGGDTPNLLNTASQPGFMTEVWKASRSYLDPERSDKPVIGFDTLADLLAQRARGLVPTGAPLPERRAFVMVGYPGAGKSTIAQSLRDSQLAAHVVSDDARHYIPEYAVSRNAAAVHEEATHIAKAQASRITSKGENIILETIGSLDGIETLSAGLRAQGYRITLVLIDTPRALAMEQAIDRWRRTGRAAAPKSYKGDIRAVYEEAKRRGLIDDAARIEREPGGTRFSLAESSSVLVGFEDELRVERGLDGRHVDRSLEGRAGAARAQQKPAQLRLGRSGNPRRSSGSAGHGFLFAVPPPRPLTPRAQALVPASINGVQTELARMVPSDVAIRIKDRLVDFTSGRSLDAAFDPVSRLIQVAYAKGPWTAKLKGFHEVVHALREHGRKGNDFYGMLFSKEEWSTLVERAKKIGVDDMIGAEILAFYRSAYRNVARLQGFTGKALNARVEELIDQERVAKLAEVWAEGSDFGTKVNTLLDRIVRLIQAVHNWWQGRGFFSEADIFADVSPILSEMVSGNVARRAGIGVATSATDAQAMLMAKVVGTPAGRAAIDSAQRSDIIANRARLPVAVQGLLNRAEDDGATDLAEYARLMVAKRTALETGNDRLAEAIGAEIAQGPLRYLWKDLQAAQEAAQEGNDADAVAQAAADVARLTDQIRARGGAVPANAQALPYASVRPFAGAGGAIGSMREEVVPSANGVARRTRVYSLGDDAGSSSSITLAEQPDGTWEVSAIDALPVHQDRIADHLEEIEVDLPARLSPTGFLTQDAYRYWLETEPAAIQFHIGAGAKFDNLYISPRAARFGVALMEQMLPTSGPYVRPEVVQRRKEVKAELERLLAKFPQAAFFEDNAVAKFSDQRLFAIDRLLPDSLRARYLEWRYPQEDSIGDATNGSGQALFAIAGPSAAFADGAALGRAKALAQGNAKPAVIWKETGWYQGEDGQWRFEIDDSGARLITRNDGLGAKLLGKALGRQERNDDWYIQRDEEDGSVYQQDFEGDLGRVLRHPKLYEQYPALRNLPVKIGIGAYYEGSSSGIEEGFITVHAGRPDEVVPILLHEIQHWIQDVESFEGGGSPQMIEMRNEIAAYDLRNEIKRLKGSGQGHNIMPALEEALTAIEASKSRLMTGWFGPSPSGMQAYHGLRGEVEARNVMTRLPMTAAKRRAAPPWTTQDVPVGKTFSRDAAVALEFPDGPAIEARVREIVNGTLAERPALRQNNVISLDQVLRDLEDPGAPTRLAQAEASVAKYAKAIAVDAAKLADAKGIKPRSLLARLKGESATKDSLNTIEFLESGIEGQRVNMEAQETFALIWKRLVDVGFTAPVAAAPRPLNVNELVGPASFNPYPSARAAQETQEEQDARWAAKSQAEVEAKAAYERLVDVADKHYLEVNPNERGKGSRHVASNIVQHALAGASVADVASMRTEDMAESYKRFIAEVGAEGVQLVKDARLRAELIGKSRGGALSIPVPPDREVDEAGYYSAALEAARVWHMSKGAPAQVLSQMKSHKVKATEMRAIGLESFLEDKMRSGQKPVVTKTELVAFLEKSRVLVDVTRFYGSESAASMENRAEAIEAARESAERSYLEEMHVGQERDDDAWEKDYNDAASDYEVRELEEGDVGYDADDPRWAIFEVKARTGWARLDAEHFDDESSAQDAMREYIEDRVLDSDAGMRYFVYRFGERDDYAYSSERAAERAMEEDAQSYVGDLSDEELLERYSDWQEPDEGEDNGVGVVSEAGPSKWGDYTAGRGTPQGAEGTINDTYHEVVIHLRPSVREQEIDARLAEIRAAEEADKWRSDVLRAERQELAREQNNLRSMRFNQSHFDKPNIIGHYQRTLNKTAQGPVLVVHQIQSDWSQTLRDARRNAWANKLFGPGSEARKASIEEATRRLAEVDAQWDAERATAIAFLREHGPDYVHADEAANTSREISSGLHLFARRRQQDIANTADDGTTDPIVLQARMFANRMHNLRIEAQDVQRAIDGANYKASFSGLTKEQKAEVSAAIQKESNSGAKRIEGTKDLAKIAELEKRVEELEEKITGLNLAAAALLRPVPGINVDAHRGPALLFDPARDSLDGMVGQAFLDLRRTADAQNIWAEYSAATAELEMKSRELRIAEASLPGHPMVDTTDQWLRTTLRQVVKDAVDNDAQVIAIPPGEYVLSYNPGDDHGMTEFYNKFVPNALRKILTDIDPSIQPYRTAVESVKGNAFADASVARSYEDHARMLAEAERNGNEAQAQLVRANLDQLHSMRGAIQYAAFPITDAVRSAVMSGQALFSVAGPPTPPQAPSATSKDPREVRGVADMISDLKSNLGMTATIGRYTMTISDRKANRSWRLNPLRRRAGGAPSPQGQYFDDAARLRVGTDIDAVAKAGGEHLLRKMRNVLPPFLAAHAEELTETAVPNSPVPGLAPSGFSGLELDADTQGALVEAAKAFRTWRTMTTQGTFNRDAMRKAGLDAAVQIRKLVRRLGQPTAHALLDDIIGNPARPNAGAIGQTASRSIITTGSTAVAGIDPAAVAGYVAQRYSVSGTPQPRVAPLPSRRALDSAFADFFRRVIVETDMTRRDMPGAYTAFRELLSGHNPKLLENLDGLNNFTVGEDYKAYRLATAWERAIADSGTMQEPTYWATVKEWFGTRNKLEPITAYISHIGSLTSWAMTDKTNPILKTVRALLRLADENGVRDASGRPIALRTWKDASKIARMMAGAHAIGHAWIMKGVPAYNGAVPAGPSLHQALITAFGGSSKAEWSDHAFKAFGSYLEAKRAIGEWPRFVSGEIGQPTRRSLDENIKIVQQAEAAHPSYKQAAQMVYDWQHRLLTMEFEAGKWSKEAYAALTARKDFYVPYRRMVDEAQFGGSGDYGKIASRFTQDKRFKGHDSDIINPLETMIQRAYHTASAIQFNDMVKALAELSDIAGPDAAKFVERVTKEEVAIANTSTFDRLKEIAIGLGVDPADAHQIILDAEANFTDVEVHAMFQPTDFGPKRPPMLPLWEGGQRRLVRLNDPVMGRYLFDAMNAVGRPMSTFLNRGLINWALVKPASALRAGVTMHPAFVGANIFGDMMGAWIRTGALPVITQARGLYHLLSTNPPAARAMRAMGFTPSSLADMYTMVGGIAGGQNMAALRAVSQSYDLKEMRKEGYRFWDARAVGGVASVVAGGFIGGIVGGPVGATFGVALGATASRFALGKGAETVFSQLTDLSESITRLGVAAHAHARAKKLDPTISDVDAIREAAFTARNVLDFDRGGQMLGPIMKLIPFLNANIQGVSASYRQSLLMDGERGRINMANAALYLRARFSGAAQTRLEQEVSANDIKAIQDGGRMWVRMMTLAVVSVAISMAYADDDEVQDALEEARNTHWIIRLPGVPGLIRIKKPFQDAVFANMAEAIFRTFAQNDPRLGKHLWEGVRDTHSMPLIPSTQNLWAGWTTGVDPRTKRDIEPASTDQRSPENRYNAYASAFAIEWSRALAKLPGGGIHVSPGMIDWTLQTELAYWGREIKVISDAAYGHRGAPKFTDRPIIGTIANRFAIDPSRASASTAEFWDIMGKGKGSYSRAAADYRFHVEGGNPLATQDFLARLPKDERIFAVLQMSSTAEDKAKHPLNRTNHILSVNNTMRRELADPRGLINTTPGSQRGVPIVLDPATQTVVDDVLGRLSALEAWNALHLLGREGWAHREVRQPEPILAELETASPEAFAEMMRRRKANRVDIFERDNERWVRVQEKVERLIEDEDMLGRSWNRSFERRRGPARRPPESGQGTGRMNLGGPRDDELPAEAIIPASGAFQSGQAQPATVRPEDLNRDLELDEEMNQRQPVNAPVPAEGNEVATAPQLPRPDSANPSIPR